MGWVQKHPHSVLEHCVSYLPSLVVHHHLTKVILIGIIFLSHKFSSGVWLLEY